MQFVQVKVKWIICLWKNENQPLHPFISFIVILPTSHSLVNCDLPTLITTSVCCHGYWFHCHHHHHQSLNREGRWGTTDDFATNFLHFSLFSTALWDLANSRPVLSLMLSSHLFLCLPCLLPPFTVPFSIGYVAALLSLIHMPYIAYCRSLARSMHVPSSYVNNEWRVIWCMLFHPEMAFAVAWALLIYYQLIN